MWEGYWLCKYIMPNLHFMSYAFRRAAWGFNNIYFNCCYLTFWLHLDGRKDGNSFNSGPAPPPPPGTPPITKSNRNHKSGSNNSPSGSDNSDGSKKSGIGGGGIAGIIISLLVVGAVVAFFLVKRRSKRSSADIEKPDNQPLAPLASNDMHGNLWNFAVRWLVNNTLIIPVVLLFFCCGSEFMLVLLQVWEFHVWMIFWMIILGSWFWSSHCTLFFTCLSTSK